MCVIGFDPWTWVSIPDILITAIKWVNDDVKCRLTRDINLIKHFIISIN